MKTVLSAKALNRRFDGIVVADNIDFELRAGEVVALIGPNGAGKTTLFNLLTGFVAPHSGEIRLHERNIERLSPSRRARLGVARTWQSPRLFSSLSVLDNLLVADRAYPGGSLLHSLLNPRHVAAAGAAARARAEALLARIGLARRASTLATRLSYGQQKLVGLGRALMNEGSCLLLDEPMAGVEGRTHETTKELIRAEAASGKAICIVEHNVNFVRDLCDRAAFMINGRIVAHGTVDELLADKRLTALYFGGRA
jgi:branched-chain amino acid transport system ATP-binding protein